MQMMDRRMHRVIVTEMLTHELFSRHFTIDCIKYAMSVANSNEDIEFYQKELSKLQTITSRIV